MKLSPSTIAANLTAAAAAEAEAEAEAAASTSNSIQNINISSTITAVTATNTTNVPLNTSTSTATGMATVGLNTTTGTNDVPRKSTPRDTQIIMAILKEMGIPDYDARVLPQLVEFAYRYASRVLEDAQLFSIYAKKKVIDTDDVSLAIQTQFDRSFVGPPSRDILLEIARSKNSQPLPPIKSHNGLRLPADRFSLVASNVRLINPNRLSDQHTNNSTTSIINRTQINSSLLLNSKRKFDET